MNQSFIAAKKTNYQQSNIYRPKPKGACNSRDMQLFSLTRTQKFNKYWAVNRYYAVQALIADAKKHRRWITAVTDPSDGWKSIISSARGKHYLTRYVDIGVDFEGDSPAKDAWVRIFITTETNKDRTWYIDPAINHIIIFVDENNRTITSGD